MPDSTPCLVIDIPRVTPRIFTVPRGGVLATPRIEVRPRYYQR